MIRIAFCCVILLLQVPCLALETGRAVDQAVAKGLAWLATQQNQDGSFAGSGPRIAITGLTVMAFLADGHTPDVGRYGDALRAAIDFLVAAAPADGYYGRVDGSRMYGQAISTLALAEACGVESDGNRHVIRPILSKAVRVILDAQAVTKQPVHQGGWRYEPQSPDSDLSLTGWNVLALRACRNVGVEVDKTAIERALAYVLRCYRPKQGFAYIPGGEASPSMTGVGLLTIHLIGNAQQPELLDASEALKEKPATDRSRFPYYDAYYAVQAANQIGGEIWTSVWTRTRDWIIARQQQDGSWPASATAEEPGVVYSTSMAILTLTVPAQLLPAYQR
jgi:hypothetical protein